jgi:hypothetical protein
MIDFLSILSLFLFMTCISNNPSMSIYHIYTFESLLRWKQGISTPLNQDTWWKADRASRTKRQPSIQPCVLQCNSWPWQLDRSSCSSRLRPLGAHRGTDPHTHSGIWSLSADTGGQGSQGIIPKSSDSTYCNFINPGLSKPPSYSNAIKDRRVIYICTFHSSSKGIFSGRVESDLKYRYHFLGVWINQIM